MYYLGKCCRVFKRQNTRPSTPTGGSYDSPVPDGWSDGVPSGQAIIWSSTCTFYGNGLSTGWSVPAPESDSTTLDIEFSPTIIQPEVPQGSIPFSNHEEEGWYDPNSANFDNVGKMIWRAERKVSNGVYNGDWVITRIYGEKGDSGGVGPSGGHYEFRYINFTPSENSLAPTKPATGSDGTTGGWSAAQTDLSELEIKNGTATWMTQCYKTGTDVYGAWTNPIRITGSNGIDGTDGDELEFVYTRNNTGETPPTPPTNPNNDWPRHLNDQGISIGYQTVVVNNKSYIWYDNPQGVTENMMWEFVSTRTKVQGVWSAYSSPVVWSKWGEKGMDGDGFEYIFKKFQTVQNWANITGDNNPANWKTNHPTEFQNTREYLGPTNETKWSDDPQGIDENYKYEYVSVRQEIDGVWNDYSTPTLWSGIPGGHYEFRYTKSKDIPDTPTAGQDTPSSWSVAQQSISESDFKEGYKVWMTYCFKTVENTYGTWSYPIRISGANGLDGEDGSDIEFLYARTKTSTAPTTKPSKPSSGDGSYTYGGVTRTWKDEDWGVGKSTDVAATDGDTTWSDNPRGVTDEIKYEWVIVRTKPAGKNTSFEDFSPPTIWSKWGEKGMDGDGMQYVFKLFDKELDSTERSSTYKPTKEGITQNNGEWIPSGWNDDPPTVSSEHPYCYCSTIKKTNGTWGDFETLSLWAKYSKDSTVAGPDGKGITYIITREGESESYWTSNATVGANAYFSRNRYSNTPDIGTNCRVGDFFIVKGTAQGGKFHQATYKCTSFETTAASGQSYPRIFGDCISHIKDGITGKTGPMFYIAGIWNSTTEYTKNDYKCPVVFYDDGTNERYYYLIASSSKNQNPSSNSSVWGLADNFEAIFTKVLFSNFAKLGSFIMNQDWMISQHGVEYDSSGNLTVVSGDNTTNYQNFKTSSPTENLSGQVNFCPNLAIDAKTGRVYAQRMDVGGSSTFKGTVYAENGMFNGSVNAQQFTAGDPTGINITIEDDSIYFNYGGEHRAWFTTKDGQGNNGAGMYLYIKNPDNNATSNKVITIDFANLKFKDASGGSQAGLPQENYYSAGTNGMANQHTTIYLGPTDGLYYSNTGCTQLLNNTVYYKKLQHSYFILMQKSAEAKYYKQNIDLYQKITFTNGVASTGTTPLYKITKQGQTAYVYGSSSAVSASNTNVYSNASCTDLYVGTSGNVNWVSGDVYLGKTSSTSGNTYISLCTLISSNNNASTYGPRERATIA